MENKHNICVVGAGRWGKNHIKTLHSLSSLGGVVDNNSKLLSHIRKEYPYCKVYDDLEYALKDNFDGYIIATPPSSHFKLSKKIIESYKPLLVEKPLTLDLKSAIELNRIAKEKKVNLMVGHVLLFHPAFIKMKNFIDSGKLGDIQYIYSNRLNLGTIRTDENVFWSFAPHDISLLNYFFDENPSCITSRGIDILQKNIHDTTITSFHYENNKMGHIFVSWLHPFKEHRFVIIGSNGMLHFEDSLENKPLLFYDKKTEYVNSIPNPSSGEIIKINYENIMPLENELKYFLSKLNSEKIETANGDSAVDVIRILENATKDLMKGN